MKHIPLEEVHENRAVRWAVERGIPAIKLNLQGNRGWPDRLFLFPYNRMFFIEFKRQGEEPTPLQVNRHKFLKKWGYDVEVHESAETAIRSLEARLEAACLPKEGG